MLLYQQLPVLHVKDYRSSKLSDNPCDIAELTNVLLSGHDGGTRKIIPGMPLN